MSRMSLPHRRKNHLLGRRNLMSLQMKVQTFHPQMSSLKQRKSQAVVKRHLNIQMVKQIETDLWMILILERVLKLTVHPVPKIRGGMLFVLDRVCYGLHRS